LVKNLAGMEMTATILKKASVILITASNSRQVSASR